VKTLNRVLNPPLTKLPTTPATTNAPANPNQSKTIQCVHSKTILVPKYVDNPVLNEHVDLMLNVGRVDDGKFLALNEFEEFKERVWEFMVQKKLDALTKSSQMIAPNYIVNIGVYHAFKLAEQHMGRYHTNLVARFAAEYTQLSKYTKTKKQRAAVAAKLKERLQEYEYRVTELDCLFQKGLAFLVPAKKAQAEKKNSKAIQNPKASTAAAGNTSGQASDSSDKSGDPAAKQDGTTDDNSNDTPDNSDDKSDASDSTTSATDDTTKGKKKSRARKRAAKKSAPSQVESMAEEDE